jgi:hypothetical protein
MKKLQLFLVIAGCVFSGAAAAANIKEHWQTVSQSVTALLNEGWAIRHYSVTIKTSYVEWLILEKNGKYIRCYVAYDTNNSACVSLN